MFGAPLGDVLRPQLKISKTTPCKVAGSSRHEVFRKKGFDTSGKSGAFVHHRAIWQKPWPTDSGLLQRNYTGGYNL
jgi:hypothetical protein